MFVYFNSISYKKMKKEDYSLSLSYTVSSKHSQVKKSVYKHSL